MCVWCVHCINSVEVGVQVDQPTAKGPQLQVYKEHFESQFLEETVSYYAKESAAFLEKNPVAEYIKKVEVRLGEEEHRVQVYLHETSQDPVSERCCSPLLLSCGIFGSHSFSDCHFQSLPESWKKSSYKHIFISFMMNLITY